MHISKEGLLAALLAGPYSHFREVGTDDWRDPSEKNAGFSLSSKGFRDHRSGESGSLYELAKQNDLGILNGHQSDDKNNLPQAVWDQSTRTDDQQSEAHRLVTAYLTGHRKISPESYTDLLSSGLIRVNHHKGDRMLVSPSLTPRNYRDAVAGKVFSVNRLQRVFLNTEGSKHSKGKKHLGSEKAESYGFVIPPLSGNLESTNAQVFEGLEDALSIRDRFSDQWVLVATDKGGLKKLAGFFGDDRFQSARIVADHDYDKYTDPKNHDPTTPEKEKNVTKPEATGQAKAWQLGETLRAKGVDVVVRMPHTPKDDANAALQAGRLDEWQASLIEIPEQFRCQEAYSGIDEGHPKESKKLDRKAVGLNIVRASEVRMKPIRWLWPDVLPIGKLSILAGDPGLGKSQVSLFVAAQVSTGGKWPVTNEGCESGNVIILSAEDGTDDTIVPRLKAGGAALERIHILHSVRQQNGQERHPDLTNDAHQIRCGIERIGNVRLIIVDPISSYLGSVDSHRNTDVRVALNPVVELAEEVGACLLCVTHLNKSSTNALSRVTGSIAFVATARASYLATKDSQNPERILMLPLKNNLAKNTFGFAFTVEKTEIGDDITSTKVVWESEPVTITADEALSPTGEVGNRLTDAEEFLKEELREGRVPSEELFARGEAQGISKKSLYGAKKRLGISAQKVGFQGAWHWELPEGDTSESAKLPDAKIPPETPKIPKQEKGASLASLASLEPEPPNQKEFTGVI